MESNNFNNGIGGGFTGPSNIPTQFNPNIPKLQESALKGDPSAQEILLLIQARDDLAKEFTQLQKDSASISIEISQYRHTLERVNNFMIGVVVAVAVGFFFMLFSLIQDKDLYSNYNNVYKSLIDQTTSQELNIKTLENTIEILKVKNYLK